MLLAFVATASLLVFSFNTSYAARQMPQHNEKLGTKVNLTAKAKSHVFSQKIQKILAEHNTKPVIPTQNNISIGGSAAILGQAVATQEQCVRYLLSVNPQPEISVTPQQLVSYYYQEGAKEGIRPDIAFAQALVETGYFRYGGTVSPEQNNYCGLGTTSTMVKGAYFATSELGVRAHIQHLLAYVSDVLPKDPIVDPRYLLVRSIYQTHTLSSWHDLNGRWAVPGNTYGQNILRVYNAIINS